MLIRRLLALAAVVAVAGCSNPPAPRDDRPAVQAAIENFGKELRTLGDITSVPAVQFSNDCGDAHWVSVQWSADLPKQPGDLAPVEIEKNVLGQALSSIRLDGVRVVNAKNNPEEMAVAQTKDRNTIVTTTVPRGEYVRVDGYVSC
jgi:predicted lipoprotein